MKTVADLLGHSSIQQTADTYGQFAEGIHGGAVADLGEAMAAEKDPKAAQWLREPKKRTATTDE